MKDQHTKIKGYRDLSQDEIDMMNRAKEVGETIETLIVSLERSEGSLVDKRWVSIGKTHLQQGIMALVRSIAKPESF